MVFVPLILLSGYLIGAVLAGHWWVSYIFVTTMEMKWQLVNLAPYSLLMDLLLNITTMRIKPVVKAS